MLDLGNLKKLPKFNWEERLILCAFLFVFICMLTFRNLTPIFYFAFTLFIAILIYVKRRDIAILIAFLALILTVSDSFRDLIYPFRLSVSPVAMLITKKTATLTPPSVVNNFNIATTAFFTNKGYGDALIENIYLLVKGETDKNIKYYSFAYEASAAKAALNDLNTGMVDSIHPAFILRGKEIRAKDMHFLQDGSYSKYPISSWEIGTYLVEIYIKVEGQSEYRQYKTFTVDITSDDLQKWNNQSSIHKRLFMKSEEVFN